MSKENMIELFGKEMSEKCEVVMKGDTVDVLFNGEFDALDMIRYTRYLKELSYSQIRMIMNGLVSDNIKANRVTVLSE